ncbi:MAG: glutamate racemase [Patescibacteria group bacterium]
MIGIFDSGIGGLTVVKEIFQQLPGYPVVYFGDTARTPYGSKSEEAIKRYALEDANFLLRRGASIIVIACNTASAVAAEYLKKELKVPVFEVISPAVLAAERLTVNNKIGVIGTRATIGSQIYKKELRARDKKYEVYSQAAPLLVPLVEENWLKRAETMMILKKYLLPLKQFDIDTLILGCTHYPLLQDAIARKMGRNVKLVDSAFETVKMIRLWLKENPEKDSLVRQKEGQEFFVSDITPNFQNIAEKLLGRKVRLTQRSVDK